MPTLLTHFKIHEYVFVHYYHSILFRVFQQSILHYLLMKVATHAEFDSMEQQQHMLLNRMIASQLTTRALQVNSRQKLVRGASRVYDFYWTNLRNQSSGDKFSISLLDIFIKRRVLLHHDYRV